MEENDIRRMAELAEDVVYFLLQDDFKEDNISKFKEFISTNEYKELLKIFMQGK